MGDGAVKHGSNKEVQAVMFNLKQERILEKTLQTIDLEESYAVKLLALGDREVRLRQSNLKTRVSKIKSYLEPKDVKEIRDLEMKGKLKPMYTSLNTNSALRIAATAKRLNIGPDGKTLLQKGRVKSGNIQTRRSNTPTPRLPRRRRNSLVGVFIDATERPSDSFRRRSSVDLTADVVFKIEESRSRSPSLPPTPRLGRGPRPITSNGFFGESAANKTPRAKTSAALVPPSVGSHAYLDTSPSRCDTEVSRRARDSDSGFRTRETSTSSRSRPGAVTRPMSQHKNRSDSESSESKSLSRYKLSRRQSSFSLGSFDKDQAKERMHEALTDRLEMQQLQASEIQKKKKDFMKKINRWVEENPSLIKDTEEPYNARADTKKPQTSTPTNLLDGHFLLRKNNDRISLSDQWTDLKKCRYLRIPDNKIDYSGVNTLVRDQLVLYNSSLKGTIKEEQEVS